MSDELCLAPDDPVQERAVWMRCRGGIRVVSAD